MADRHLVWDWNGTLLDDLPIVLEAVNVSVSALGGAHVDEARYRDHYTRPVKAFYEGLFQRTISDEEWHLLNDTYHEAYYGNVHRAMLAPDAFEAMDRIETIGWGQSLLSMTPQRRLEVIVEGHGLAERLSPLTGLPAQTGGMKAEFLELHLERLGVQGDRVVVVGDTPDDVAAARAVGAPSVLYDGGSHHRHHLDEVGVPVAHTLVDAVEIASSL